MDITSNSVIQLLEQLEQQHELTINNYETLFCAWSPALQQEAQTRARRITDQVFGRSVYTRGLIEFSNVCRNDCFYCGLRKSNPIQRYRLTKDEILESCQVAWDLGYQTFVLQSGDDPYFTLERLADIVSTIRSRFPEAAITLSVGERSHEEYEAWFKAGANRYLLRHESRDPFHYAELHPSEMSVETRLNCLEDLKSIGYHVGAGFMVGSPEQTVKQLAQDLKFIETFDPEMVGVGPFMPAADTPFAEKKAGDLNLTLFILSLLRIQKPNRLIPATTAIASLHPQGRELALNHGANVIMPNVTPLRVRGNYQLYDRKICISDQAADYKAQLDQRLAEYAYVLVSDRGDYKEIQDEIR